MSRLGCIRGIPEFVFNQMFIRYTFFRIDGRYHGLSSGKMLYDKGKVFARQVYAVSMEALEVQECFALVIGCSSLGKGVDKNI